MKKLFGLVSVAVAISWAGTGTSRADEALRRIQQELRDQGFYYGPVDGSPGDETKQALRRYQIRNGLPVTGELDDETKRTIQKTGDANQQASGGDGLKPTGYPKRPLPAPGQPASPERQATPDAGYQRPTVRPAPNDDEQGNGGNADSDTPASRGPVTVRPNQDADDDAPVSRGPVNRRPDLRADGGAPEDRPLPRNAVLPSAQLTTLFANTPYEFAPPPVQAGVLRDVQRILTRDGFYDGAVNGVPSEATAEALAEFQGVNRLHKTGRLDVSTLGVLHLLPGRQTVTPRDRDDNRDGPNIIFQGRIAH